MQRSAAMQLQQSSTAYVAARMLRKRHASRAVMAAAARRWAHAAERILLLLRCVAAVTLLLLLLLVVLLLRLRACTRSTIPAPLRVHLPTGCDLVIQARRASCALLTRVPRNLRLTRARFAAAVTDCAARRPDALPRRRHRERRQRSVPGWRRR
jgi:hypothetical protein